MGPVLLLTVLAIWVGLAVPAAVFVAALGRGGLREEQARNRIPAHSTAATWQRTRPIEPAPRRR